MKFFSRLIAAGLMLTALNAYAGRSAPIVNHEDVPAIAASGQPATADQIRKALPAAGAKRGWAIAAAGPGKMLGTLNNRGFTAVVDIAYSGGKYSIKYRDSVNLNYQAGEGAGTIHPTYNKWVDNLMNDIRIQLLQP